MRAAAPHAADDPATGRDPSESGGAGGEASKAWGRGGRSCPSDLRGPQRGTPRAGTRAHDPSQQTVPASPPGALVTVPRWAQPVGCPSSQDRTRVSTGSGTARGARRHGALDQAPRRDGDGCGTLVGVRSVGPASLGSCTVAGSPCPLSPGLCGLEPPAHFTSRNFQELFVTQGKSPASSPRAPCLQGRRTHGAQVRPGV